MPKSYADYKAGKRTEVGTPTKTEQTVKSKTRKKLDRQENRSQLFSAMQDYANNEAEMTFGKAYNPTASERNTLGNVVAAGGRSWRAGQKQAAAAILDPTDDDSATDAAMMFYGTGNEGKTLSGLENNAIAKWMKKQRGAATSKLRSSANTLQAEAAEAEQTAKQGKSKVQQILIDAGIAGTQLAMDVTVGRLTGTGMASMGTRTFGQSYDEATKAGANQQQAFNYAASAAAVEMLTEKIFDVAQLFGGGAADDMIEKAVGKWAKTPAGRNAMRTLFAAATEGGEEIASDVVNPIIREFYQSGAAKEAFFTKEGLKNLASDAGRDALIGMILGGVGNVANVGNNRAKNAEIDYQNALKAEQETADRVKAADAANARQAELMAGNAMQTGTANAEALEVLNRNAVARGEKPAPTMADMIEEVVKATPAENLVKTTPQASAENVQTMPETATENVQVNAQEPQTRTAAQDIDEITQTLGKNPTWDDLIEHARNSENGVEMYQRVMDAVENGELIDAGNSGIFPKAEIERRQNAYPEDNHIDNRSSEEIRSTKVKAFQHEHPELHNHFAKVAQKIYEEAAESITAGVTAVKKRNGGGTKGYYPKGIRHVMDSTGLSRQKIIKICEDIINNHGSENYADAKRVEIALDELLSGQRGNGTYQDDEYLQKKGQIAGGLDPNSFEYALENEYSLLISIGEMTEEEAYDDWRREQEERAAQNAVESPVSNPNAEAVQDTTPTAENSESTAAAAQTNELPQGQGAMSPAFPYREAQSQTNSTSSALNEEERANVVGLRPEDATHQVRTDADVIQHAQERLDYDYDGEKADLFDQSREWDAVDREVAYQILDAEVKKARETGDYSEVVKIKKEMDARGSSWGQVGHTMARHAHTAADIVGEAATILDEGDNAFPKDTTKEDVLNDIAEEADALEKVREEKNNDLGKAETELIEMIKRLNAKRRTGGLFTPNKTGKFLNNTLEAVIKQDGGFDFLLDVCEAQLRARASDFKKLSALEAIKSVRYQAMLSKLTTTMRNLVGNNVFDPVESFSNNVGILADLLMGLRTKRNTTAFDASWASKAKRSETWKAMQRAYIEAALDADTSGTENRFEQTSGRTFKMARNPLIRFLSTVEKYQAYMLSVTDEMQKGGIRAEQQRGIDRLVKKGKLEEGALDGWADETARERTFQNQGKMATGLQGLRSSANTFASLKDSKGGSFGLGDAILPFARVPANIVGQFMNYSPAGLAKGTLDMLKVMKKGTKATAQEQAAAARAFGRGVNGTAILSVFAWMAAKGVLNVADGGDDDESKDLAKMRQTEGITGTQFNIDAAIRGLSGESTDWKNGDDIMNIGFLEPINGLMALGSLLWDSAQDDGLTAGDIGSATAEAALEAISDLPAVSSLTNIFNNYKYSTAESTGGKVAESGVKFLGDTVTSFIPNALAGIAQGTDEGTVRETYAKGKGGVAGVAENTLRSAMSKIPGLRQQLPTSLDAFGQEKKTTASAWQNWLNSNILPGSITKYQTNNVKSELERLYDSGADVKIPDRYAPKKVATENGDKTLTEKEQRAYQKNYGAEVANGLNKLFASKEYKNLSTAEQAQAVNNIQQYAKAQAEQKAGGKAETPSWATKGGNSVTDNAMYYAMLQTVKQSASGTKDSDIMAALAKKNYDYDTTVQIMSQFMSDSSVKNYTKAYSHGYDFDVSAAFQAALKETSYDWGTTDAGNPKTRGKDRTIQWAQENLGLTYNQAATLYKYLNP